MSGGTAMACCCRQYRCEKCGTTSPGDLGEVPYNRERQNHRTEFHGGHIPDCERMIEAPRLRYFERPRIQQIVSPIVIVGFLIAVYFRMR